MAAPSTNPALPPSPQLGPAAKANTGYIASSVPSVSTPSATSSVASTSSTAGTIVAQQATNSGENEAPLDRSVGTICMGVNRLISAIPSAAT